MSFHVGQKVVCVDASGLRYTKPLQVGSIYTIRDVYVEDIDGPGVLLDEIVNAMHPRGEFGYRPYRFRPLIDRKSSISFTEGAPKDSEKYDNRRKVEVRA